MLKEAGADLTLTLNGKGQGNVNLLYIAAQSGSEVIVGYLIDKGIFPDGNQKFDINEETPIQIATKNAHFNVVQILIDKSKDLGNQITK